MEYSRDKVRTWKIHNVVWLNILKLCTIQLINQLHHKHETSLLGILQNRIKVYTLIVSFSFVILYIYIYILITSSAHLYSDP